MSKRLLALLLLSSAFYCKGEGEETLQLAPIQDAPFTLESGGVIDPLAAPGATKGGEFRLWGGPFPKTLNSWLDNWSTTAEINALMFHSLVGLHSVRNEPVGDLAASWKADPDGRTFTFSIHPHATWSDGKPITAGDVVFYYDVIMNPRYLTTTARSVVGRFERPEVIDDKTVRIRAKERYWKAFWDAGDFVAFPKHVWDGKDFNEVNFEFPVVSGPYRIRDLRRNRFVLLERRPDWWGRSLKYNQGKFNFDYIRYRFLEDRNAALEAFTKGDYDSYPVYTASIWAAQTKTIPGVQKGWIVRQEIFNREPRGFQGMAINLRRPKFQDPRVREALAYLLDRQEMNEKLMHNAYFLLNSYFPDLYPGNQNPARPVRMFDLEKARALLDAAGWKVGPDGIRTKDGQKLSVTFVTDAADQRHLNLYVQDLASAGIQAKIELLSKAEVTRRTDNFDFDLYWINTGAGRLRDPEPMFLGQYADEKGSANLPGVKDANVDDLLKQLRQETDLNRRNQILERLDNRLNEIGPYVLMWQSDRTRMLYWNRFGKPEHMLGKYARENAAVVYWWLDRERDAALRDAREKDDSLPLEPETIRYNGP